jgi:hypothetical protein
LKNSTPRFAGVESKKGKDADHETISSPRRVCIGDRAGGDRRRRGTDPAARSVRSQRRNNSDE